MAPRTWFITGTSRGFGREWALAALDRGDRVVGTARNTSTMDDIATDHDREHFLPLQLDVTDRGAAFDAVRTARDHFGELDIVVNNAGYGHFGMVEELSEMEARDQIETNLFGAFWVTQAALPFMREQGHGHFLQVSSIGGISAFPTVGIYHASKWGLEGFSQALAQEVRGLRHPRHADRARRLLHRLGRRLCPALGTACSLRRGARGAAAALCRQRPGRSGRLCGGGAEGRRCRSAAAALLLRQVAAWRSRRPTTRAVWRIGTTGSRSPSSRMVGTQARAPSARPRSSGRRSRTR